MKKKIRNAELTQPDGILYSLFDKFIFGISSPSIHTQMQQFYHILSKIPKNMSGFIC